MTLITTIFFFSVRPENARITSKREPLSAGRDYLLECKSYGSRPPATITWWKNSKFMKKAESQVRSKLCRLGICMCKKLCRYVQFCIISCSTAESFKNGENFHPSFLPRLVTAHLKDVLWYQPIKLIQLISTSEFHEYWWNDFDFLFFSFPPLCAGPLK